MSTISVQELYDKLTEYEGVIRGVVWQCVKPVKHKENTVNFDERCEHALYECGVLKEWCLSFGFSSSKSEDQGRIMYELGKIHQLMHDLGLQSYSTLQDTAFNILAGAYRTSLKPRNVDFLFKPLNGHRSNLTGSGANVRSAVTGRWIYGVVTERTGKKSFSWVSQNGKLGCTLTFDLDLDDWVAGCFINLEAAAKADFGEKKETCNV